MTRNVFAAVMVALLVVALASVSEAQTQGRGQQGGTGGGAQAPVQGELDLPLGQPTPAEYVNPNVDDDDPPSDDDPPTFYDEEIPATSSVTYVIDISGSMGWGSTTYTTPDGQVRSGTPLDRAKAELIRSINSLSEDFDFNCFAYDCSIRQMWGAPREATDDNKASARAWVSALQDMGATGTGPATVAALGQEEESVVLLTDGDPNCGCESGGGGWGWGGYGDYIQCHKNMILSNNPNGCTVSTFGIGDYGEFAQFLRDIASATGGIYVHIN